MAKKSLLEKKKTQYKNENATKIVEPENSDRISIDSRCFDKYKRYKKENKTFDFIPGRVDTSGNLFFTDENGITIILKGEVFKKTFIYYNPRNPKSREGFINRTIKTIITDIDEDNGVVELAGDPRFFANILIKDIQKELRKKDSGDEYDLSDFNGTVTKVGQAGVNINILDYGIRGFIEKSDWASYPVRRLEDLCHEGEIIQFDIVGTCPKKGGLPIQFKCDHKPYAMDPWKSIPDMEKDTIILVTCTEKPKGKTYWWGVSNSVPGIQIQCDYNSSFEIVENGVYKCFIRDLNKTKYIARATSFEAVTEYEELSMDSVIKTLGLPSDASFSEISPYSDSKGNSGVVVTLAFEDFIDKEIDDYEIGLINYYDPKKATFIRAAYWNQAYIDKKISNNIAVFQSSEKGSLINMTGGKINASKNLYFVIYKSISNDNHDPIETDYVILSKKLPTQKIIGVKIDCKEKNISFVISGTIGSDIKDLVDKATHKDKSIEKIVKSFYNLAHQELEKSNQDERFRASSTYRCAQALDARDSIESVVLLIGSVFLTSDEFKMALDGSYSLQDILQLSISRKKIPLVIRSIIPILFNSSSLDIFMNEFTKCNSLTISAYVNELSLINNSDSSDIRDQINSAIEKYKEICQLFRNINWEGKISDSSESYRQFLNNEEVIWWISGDVISLADLREFFRGLVDYDVAKGFTQKAERLQKGLEQVRKWRDAVLAYHPSINMETLFSPCFESFENKALSIYRQLCKTTKPLLTIDSNVEVEKLEDYSFVMSINAGSNNTQSAKDVKIRIKEHELFECETSVLVEKEIASDGRKVPVSILFKPRKPLPPQFSIEIGLEYKYIRDVKIIEEKKEKQGVEGKKTVRVFRGQDVESTAYWPGSTGSEWISVDIIIDNNTNKHPLSLDRVLKFVDSGNVQVDDKEVRKILQNREEQLVEIENALTSLDDRGIRNLSKKGRWAIVYGQWRVGKSVILNFIEDRFNNKERYPHAIIIKIGCNGSDKEDFEKHFATLIYRELERLMRRSPYNSVFNEIREYYGLPAHRAELDWQTLCDFMCDFIDDIRKVDDDAAVILLIDEFTEIYQAIIKGHAGEGFPIRWTELINKSNLLCVTAGGEHTVSLMDAYTPNTLQKASKSVYVQYLTLDDVDKYVHYVLGEAPEDNISPSTSYFSATSDAAIKRIYELTRGNAYLLKHLCVWIIEYIIDKNKTFLSINVVNESLDYIMKKQGMNPDNFETIYFNSLFNPFGETEEGENYVEGIKHLEDDEVRKDNLEILHSIVKLSNRDTHSCVYEELRDSIIQSMEEKIFEKRFNSLKTRGIIVIDKNRNVTVYIDLYYEIVSRLIGGSRR